MLFNVTDIGIGIPSDKFESIFERFTQLNPTLQMNLGGTGLGLSIVKGLVSLLGGSIRLESELGKGTSFYFDINYEKPTSILDDKLTEQAQRIAVKEQKTILIVEDDLYNSIFLEEVFSGDNFNIISTKSGQEAINIAETQFIDIVLMDIRLPDINGYEATQTILKTKPNMKIIAQTAYATLNERRRALTVGCVDYISKPISPKEITSLVNKYLTK